MDCCTAHLGVVRDPSLRNGGSTVVAALEDAYGAIRTAFPALPDAVIITGSGLQAGGLVWGHFARDRWIDALAAGRRPELFIGGERLATGAELTMQTLLHEAAHALAHARGVQDTSRQHRYHNRKFVAIAQELGLDYRHEAPDSVIGYSAVTITAAGRKRWGRQIDAIARARSLSMDLPAWLMALGTLTGGGASGGHRVQVKGGGSGTGGSSYVKAECSCPRIIRVSASTLDEGDITCGNCGEAFVAV